MNLENQVPDLSVIVPFHNERNSLAETVGQIREAFRDFEHCIELILIDDGSTDGSADTLAEMDRACVFALPRNRGYGAAIKKGLERARGRWVAILDADGSYPPDALPLLWEQREKADMVIGRRDRSGVPALRRPAKWFLRILAQTLSGEPIPDLNSGLRLFPRELGLRFRYLCPDGFSLTTTLTMAFLSSGHEIRYLPIAYRKRSGKSKIRPLRDTWGFLKLIFRLILFFNPMKVLLPLSFLFLCASVAVLLYSKFILHNMMDVTGTILFMLSIQLAVVAVLADLIARRNRN